MDCNCKDCEHDQKAICSWLDSTPGPWATLLLLGWMAVVGLMVWRVW